MMKARTILSIPLGPSDVRTASEMANHPMLISYLSDHCAYMQTFGGRHIRQPYLLRFALMTRQIIDEGPFHRESTHFVIKLLIGPTRRTDNLWLNRSVSCRHIRQC